ncbi:MAG TPA: Mth938-like domain-containing protein [Burkholderiales bacterium]|nr:Mth938-like domain-containing protein [Burkholderiales bacterium]
MKLHLSAATTENRFTGYGRGYVLVNNVRHEKNIVVLPERVMQWNVAEFETLSLRDFEDLAKLAPEIVLLGTGSSLRFPHPALSQALARARIGLEVMNTPAACRTYNILMAEGRKVVAALLVTE